MLEARGMSEGGVWVDRPRFGLRTFVPVGGYVLASLAIIASSIIQPSFSSVLFIVAWFSVGLIASRYVWFRRVCYSLDEEHLDIEWGRTRQTVPLRSIVATRRRRFPVNQFRLPASYTTRTFNLLEIFDDRGYRTIISPRDVEGFERELRTRVEATGRDLL